VSSLRVLVVEDYEPFRRFVCSTLGKRPELQLICEVSDGLEAVQKAEELQPDLIVLDIGLPTLNGIEAARRIRTLAPESKILFLSQESSADVVQEAFSLGALGYVVKEHAESELLAAVEAVRQGRQFFIVDRRVTFSPRLRMSTLPTVSTAMRFSHRSHRRRETKSEISVLFTRLHAWKRFPH